MNDPPSLGDLICGLVDQWWAEGCTNPRRRVEHQPTLPDDEVFPLSTPDPVRLQPRDDGGEVLLPVLQGGERSALEETGS